MLMSSQKHVWRHGISDDIAGKGQTGKAKAKAIINKLLTKCGIAMDVEKRSARVRAQSASSWFLLATQRGQDAKEAAPAPPGTGQITSGFLFSI
jgi:hypothetical protein